MEVSKALQCGADKNIELRESLDKLVRVFRLEVLLMEAEDPRIPVLLKELVAKLGFLIWEAEECITELRSYKDFSEMPDTWPLLADLLFALRANQDRITRFRKELQSILENAIE